MTFSSQPPPKPKTPGVGWFEYRGKNRKGDHRWRFVMDGPADSRGNRTRISHWCSGPVRQVEKQAREFVQLVERQEYSPPSNITVGDYLSNWVDNYVCRPSTKRGYHSIVYTHIIPVLGDIKLKNLTRERVREFYRTLAESGKKRDYKGTGAGLSARSIKHVHGVLHRALKLAVKEKLISANPSDPIDETDRLYEKPPKPKPVSYEPETLIKFMMEARSHELWPEFATLISCGMSRSELCGLQWRDISFRNKTISISRGLHIESGKVHITPPKTDNRYRDIPMPDELCKTLQAHREDYVALVSILEVPANQIHWVFCRADLSPRRPNHLTKVFGRLTRKIGYPDITLHGLRHTYASILLDQGESIKLIQELLGHFDPGFTLRTYSHTPKGAGKKAAQKMNDLLKRAGDNGKNTGLAKD